MFIYVSLAPIDAIGSLHFSLNKSPICFMHFFAKKTGSYQRFEDAAVCCYPRAIIFDTYTCIYIHTHVATTEQYISIYIYIFVSFVFVATPEEHISTYIYVYIYMLLLLSHMYIPLNNIYLSIYI